MSGERALGWCVHYAIGVAFGALIFAFPLLMTMEMWQLGFSMDRWRLVLFLVVGVLVLASLVMAPVVYLTGTFVPFAWYRIVLGVIILIVLW